MLGQLDMIRHLAEIGLGLLLVMAALMTTVIVPAATADDIAPVPLMSKHGIALVGVGIALVVLFADLQFGEHLPWSLQS